MFNYHLKPKVVQHKQTERVEVGSVQWACDWENRVAVQTSLDGSFEKSVHQCVHLNALCFQAKEWCEHLNDDLARTVKKHPRRLVHLLFEIPRKQAF